MPYFILMQTALIVVDVQNDFCPGGSLAVEGGDSVAERITELLAPGESYALVVATMDWHPAPGESEPFAHFSEEPDYVDSWPIHCVHDTSGAALHPGLSLPEGSVIVRKGQTSAAYSGFEGHDHDGVSLAEILRRHGIDSIDVVGLATDHCVMATALDARTLGLSVRVLEPLIAGVAPDTTRRALDAMRSAGITIVDAPLQRST